MARVLVTRPQPAAARTARRFAALGHEVVVAPLMTRVTLAPASWPDLGRVGGVLLTSARALEAMADDPDLAARWAELRRHPVHAVGDSTARAALAAGASDVRAGAGTLDDLVADIAASPPAGTLVHLAGRERSGDVAGALAAFAVPVVTVEVYDMVARPHLAPETRAALAAPGPRPVVAPCYSRRSAILLAQALSAWHDRPPLRFLALSAQVAAPLAGLGEVRIAATPDEAGLVALLDETC